MSEEIRYVDRRTGKLETETVYGEKALRWLYQTPAGRALERRLLSRRLFSFLYGKYLETRWSRRMIGPFVAKLGLDPEESEFPPEAYPSFNAYFTRRLKPDRRPVDPRPDAFVASAEGRLLVLACHEGKAIQVKGRPFSLARLTGNPKLARRYEGGWAFVFRLCPADYHRFHFPASGRPSPSRKIGGRYRSVNPIVLALGLPVFEENQREVGLLASDRFGPLCLVEVGAICVGSIVQTFVPGRSVAKGEEKGTFAFGGSTVIVLVEKGRLVVDQDLLDNSRRGLESLVRVGERVALRADR